jgi:hypothetical protein
MTANRKKEKMQTVLELDWIMHCAMGAGLTDWKVIANK